MTEEEKEKIKRVNMDKAKNNIKWPIVLMIIITIVDCIPVILKEVNIAVEFAIISDILLILVRIFIAMDNDVEAKVSIIYAIVTVVTTLICDIIFDINFLCKNFSYLVRIDTEIYIFYMREFITVECIRKIIKVKKNLSKANNPIANKENTDWFYERYEDK